MDVLNLKIQARDSCGVGAGRAHVVLCSFTRSCNPPGLVRVGQLCRHLNETLPWKVGGTFAQSDSVQISDSWLFLCLTGC